MRYCLFFVLLIANIKLAAQTILKTNPNPYAFQYGFTLKATIELGITRHEPKPFYRIVGSTGVSSNFIQSWLHPSFNAELQIFNGGLASRNTKFFKKPTVDFISAFTLTAGCKNYFYTNKESYIRERNTPLYYFADFVAPSLQNPFKNSVSIGTNLIFTTDKNKSKQRIGFINFHFGRFQASYYNDGGLGISDSYLGDRRDRFYTGGAVISYHGKPFTEANLIEISYHKHTGYTRNAFELSNKMYLAYMNYNKDEQKYYNKSVWSINVANLTKQYGISIKAYNHIKADVQHWIHWSIFNTYHLVPHKPYFSISGNFYNVQSNIGLR